MAASNYCHHFLPEFYRFPHRAIESESAKPMHMAYLKTVVRHEEKKG